MKPTLANFDKFIINSAREAILESFVEKSINPKEILELMDDLSLDWVDSGNKVNFSFCVENFSQSDIIFSSNLSKKYDVVLPLINTISDINRIIPNINQGKLHYIVELMTPMESPKSGKEFWESIYPIIDRIKKEYDLKHIGYFDHGFYRGTHNGETKKDLRCHSGSTVFDTNHTNLKKEVSKIWKITLLLDIK